MEKKARHVSIYYVRNQYQVNISDEDNYATIRTYWNVKLSSMSRLTKITWLHKGSEPTVHLVPSPSIWFTY